MTTATKFNRNPNRPVFTCDIGIGVYLADVETLGSLATRDEDYVDAIAKVEKAVRSALSKAGVTAVQVWNNGVTLAFSGQDTGDYVGPGEIKSWLRENRGDKPVTAKTAKPASKKETAPKKETKPAKPAKSTPTKVTGKSHPAWKGWTDSELRDHAADLGVKVSKKADRATLEKALSDHVAKHGKPAPAAAHKVAKSMKRKGGKG